MGSSHAAFIGGSDALWRNPAGLARLAPEDPSELSVGYNALLDSTYAGAAAWAKPLAGHGVLGVGFNYFSQPAQTKYNVFGDATGTFAPYDAALSAAFAKRLEKVLVGGGLKIIRSAIDGTSGMTAAVDAGVQAQHVTELGEGPLDVGASLRNLGPGLKLGAEASPLPFELRGGAFWRASQAIGVAVDLVLPADENPYATIGLEGALRQKGWAAALRLGFNAARARGLDGLRGLTAGAGFDAGRVRVDYAWVPFGDLGTTNRIQLAFRF